MAKSSLNPLLREWISKAEGDLRCALREIEVRKGPNYDAVCFHAQQCAEKYLKALMQFKSMPIKKTHDLETLINILSTDYPIFEDLRIKLQKLTDSAVDVRYPGFNPKKREAKGYLKTAEEIRKRVRQQLKLPL